jgi:hypothetical protein
LAPNSNSITTKNEKHTVTVSPDGSEDVRRKLKFVQRPFVLVIFPNITEIN